MEEEEIDQSEVNLNIDIIEGDSIIEDNLKPPSLMDKPYNTFDKFPIKNIQKPFIEKETENLISKYLPKQKTQEIQKETSTKRFIIDEESQKVDPYLEGLSSNRLKGKITLGDKTYKDDYGQIYSKTYIDMSDGIRVTYQPRQGKKENRTDATNSIFISEYLYDQDFTDGYQHSYAQNELNQLKREVLEQKDTERKFATVRIPTDTPGEYIAKVVKIEDLTERDFEDKNVYRQSWAKLSDFEISKDKKKVKLDSRDTNFRNQGILLTTEKSGDKTHNLRVSGGKGNYGDKWLEIDKLNQFGPYLGATVTIISDDGKIVKKVTGSLKDILEEAFKIQEETGGKEVHFLQSDSGSMNVKPLASDGVISKKMLGTQRNKEAWVGASEILINI